MTLAACASHPAPDTVREPPARPAGVVILVSIDGLPASMLGTAVLHVAGIALGLGLKRSSAWLPRVVGAVVALMGVNMGLGLMAG